MSDLVMLDSPISSSGLKVRILMAAIGLEHTSEEIPMPNPRPARLTDLNPIALVPVLIDGPLVLTESHAILRYVAAREGRDDVYPTDLRERAVVEEFLERFSTRFRPAFFQHEIPALGYTDEYGFDGVPRDPKRAAVVEGEIAPHIAMLDSLVGEDWAVLGRFTIADCSLGAVLFRTTITGFDLTPYPRLAALRERVMSQPWWERAGAVL